MPGCLVRRERGESSRHVCPAWEEVKITEEREGQRNLPHKCQAPPVQDGRVDEKRANVSSLQLLPGAGSLPCE